MRLLKNDKHIIFVEAGLETRLRPPVDPGRFRSCRR
jgi:hypothetical protein